MVFDFDEFYALKVLFENEANCFLEIETENGTDTFLKGREKLIARGFLELDFDGTLKQEKTFARFIYPVRKTMTSISFKDDVDYIQYLRTPLGFYSVRFKDGEYLVKKKSKSPLFEWAKNEILTAQKGFLTTRNRTDKKTTDMAEFVDKIDNKKEMLADHIAKFFEMEKAND